MSCPYSGLESSRKILQFLSPVSRSCVIKIVHDHSQVSRFSRFRHLLQFFSANVRNHRANSPVLVFLLELKISGKLPDIGVQPDILLFQRICHAIKTTHWIKESNNKISHHTFQPFPRESSISHRKAENYLKRFSLQFSVIPSKLRMRKSSKKGLNPLSQISRKFLSSLIHASFPDFQEFHHVLLNLDIYGENLKILTVSQNCLKILKDNCIK